MVAKALRNLTMVDVVTEDYIATRMDIVNTKKVYAQHEHKKDINRLFNERIFFMLAEVFVRELSAVDDRVPRSIMSYSSSSAELICREY
ncbi:hypothetical protein CEXT_262421 [Caerostris extrusa]|uniref:Uncharacterized protein n=1 Tax=Caerostris extrusa TaxID=172846 RepID=A0AAV4P548_CAEEX|nr:hypothetical protein CEXT_262421 [Caerostris extrusa]